MHRDDSTVQKFYDDFSGLARLDVPRHIRMLLSDEELNVLYMRYCLDASYIGIAKVLGYGYDEESSTTWSMGRLERTALEKLRWYYRIEDLFDDVVVRLMVYGVTGFYVELLRFCSFGMRGVNVGKWTDLSPGYVSVKVGELFAILRSTDDGLVQHFLYHLDQLYSAGRRVRGRTHCKKGQAR